MVEQIEISNIAKETLCALSYFTPTFTSKIPNYVIDRLKEIAKSSNAMVEIDKTKNLNEQHISEECKDLISLIYYRYIASKEEKRELIKIWNENEQKYQKEIREKYSSDNLFKNIKLNKNNKEK